MALAYDLLPKLLPFRNWIGENLFWAVTDDS